MHALGIGLLAAFTAAMLICTWLMLQPGWYISSGNLHDLFLPLNSALASLQGLELHKDFHTPFGWIYAELNRLAWVFIADNKSLSINDIIVVGSLFWTCFTLAAFAACMLALPKPDRPRWTRIWLLGLLIALLSFNFRGVSSFSIQDTTWYGSYNGHLWALLMLQLISAFISASGKPSLRLMLATAFTQALCVSVSVHYKASFGVAALAIASSPLFTAASSKWRSGYLTVTALSCLTFAFLVLPSGYSYELYLRDIQSALLAKSEFPNQDPHIFTAFMAVLLCVTLVLLRHDKPLARLISTKRTPAIQATDILFSSAISCGVSLAILGDFSKPFYMTCVCMALCVLSRRPHDAEQKLLQLAAVALVCVVLIANLWSNLRIAQHKVSYISKMRYEQVTIPTSHGDLKWHITKYSAYDDLTRLFAIDDSPQQLTILLNIAFPAENDRHQYHVPFQNNDYVKSLNLTRSTVASLMKSPRDKVLMLAFANPLPILVGGRLPTGSHHWIHFGTSLPMFERDNELFSEFRSADVIALPVTSIDTQSQIFLNCKFFDWNLRHGHPYKLVKFDKYNLYYSQAPDAIGIPHREADVHSRCEERIHEFRTGKALPH